MNDSIFNSKQTQLFQSIDFDDEKKRQEQIIQQKQIVSRIRTYSLTAALAIFSSSQLFYTAITGINKKQILCLLNKKRKWNIH